jgi:tryptophanyl-tRNA synthetase
MAKGLISALAPIREKRSYYEARMGEVKQIMVEGSNKARKVAQQTMQEVREAVKI